MLFRAPTEEPVRLALLSGHVAIVHRDNEGDHAPWRALPPHFHQEALARGCECDTQIARADASPIQAGPDAMNQSAGYDDSYRAALVLMIERSEEGDFTKDKLPNISAVTKICGFTAKKEDVLRVWRVMIAEIEQEG